MKWIISLSILLLAAQIPAFGQTSLKADVNDKGKITLEDAPLAPEYELTLSNLSFTNSEKAQVYFQNLKVEDVRFSIDEKKQTLIIHLDIEKNAHWTRSMWTSYLARHINLSNLGS